MEPHHIAAGGSASDPCHLGHYALVDAVIKSKLFDEVRWVVSGTRFDKLLTAPADDRVATSIQTFPREWHEPNRRPQFKIDFENAAETNMPTIEYLERLQSRHPHADITWFTGSDVLVPKEELGGKCQIETWIRGEELMQNWKFLVLPRESYPHPSTFGLPSNFTILDIKIHNFSSSYIREQIKNGKVFEHMLSHDVVKYIKERGLYGWKGQAI